MADRMRSYSVTITVTPRQAVAMERALAHASLTASVSDSERSRVFAAHTRVMGGLWDAGWEWDGSSRTWKSAA